MTAPESHSHAEVTEALSHAVAAVLIVPTARKDAGGLSIGWDVSVMQRGGPLQPPAADLVDMLREAANGLEALA